MEGPSSPRHRPRGWEPHGLCEGIWGDRGHGLGYRWVWPRAPGAAPPPGCQRIPVPVTHVLVSRATHDGLCSSATLWGRPYGVRDRGAGSRLYPHRKGSLPHHDMGSFTQGPLCPCSSRDVLGSCWKGWRAGAGKRPRGGLDSDVEGRGLNKPSLPGAAAGRTPGREWVGEWPAVLGAGWMRRLWGSTQACDLDYSERLAGAGLQGWRWC